MLGGHGIISAKVFMLLAGKNVDEIRKSYLCELELNWEHNPNEGYGTDISDVYYNGTKRYHC